MKQVLAILAVALLPLTQSLAQGTIAWDESVNGSFAQSFETPTILPALQLGSNMLSGATEVERTGDNWFGHDDYFVLEVPANFVVTAVFVTVNKPSVWAWIGDEVYLNQLGFTPNPSNGELLAQWGLGDLGPGAYGMYLANHDLQPFTSVANYRLDFFVQSIPEPSVIGIASIGAAALLYLRSRSLHGRFTRPDDRMGGERPQPQRWSSRGADFIFGAIFQG